MQIDKPRPRRKGGPADAAVRPVRSSAPPRGRRRQEADRRGAGRPVAALPPIGVAIVTYRSADVIAECLSSLLRSHHPDLRIVVCDNDSPDDTVGEIHRWAFAHEMVLAERDAALGPARAIPVSHGITLLRSSRNLGFAGGVNACLRMLHAEPDLSLFWVLNPDCVATPHAPIAYAEAALAAGPFALIGGRTLYREPPHRIQSDGGRINPLSAVCSHVNQGRLPHDAKPPEAGSVDFVSGANMVASRRFVEVAGPMREDYFLYFEEVDWAFRRGGLPILLAPDAVVHHHGGTAIGSGVIGRRPSAFANYFNYRNRIRFAARHRPLALPVAWTYAMLKAGQLVLLGAFDEAAAVLRGTHQLPPSRSIARRLAGEDPSPPRAVDESWPAIAGDG